MRTAPKDVVLVESYKDASLLDLDQVSLGWCPADGSLETASEKGKQSIWHATKYRRIGRQPEPTFLPPFICKSFLLTTVDQQE